MKRSLLLTFDTEEFDLPSEFGLEQSAEEQLAIGSDGTKILLSLLERERLRATFFVTAYFAKRYPALMRTIAKKHEIALHGAKHSDNYRVMPAAEALHRLKAAKKDVERIIKKPIAGFRAPRFQAPAIAVIRQAGFTYDSSLHPTFIPGRYNNFSKPRRPFANGGIVEVPLSVSPLLRMPFSWIGFRQMPLLYAKFHSWLALRSTGFLHLYFHPWEFVSLARFTGKLPAAIIMRTGRQMQERFVRYVRWCRRQGCEDVTAGEFLRRRQAGGE